MKDARERHRGGFDEGSDQLSQDVSARRCGAAHAQSAGDVSIMLSSRFAPVMFAGESCQRFDASLAADAFLGSVWEQSEQRKVNFFARGEARFLP